MEAQGYWHDIIAEVEEILNSCAVGRLLMEKAMQQVSLEKVAKVVHMSRTS